VHEATVTNPQCMHGSGSFETPLTNHSQLILAFFLMDTVFPKLRTIQLLLNKHLFC